jgi:hypothetical protein
MSRVRTHSIEFGCLTTWRTTLALSAVIAFASLPVAAQSRSKSNQKAGEKDAAMVSRSVSRTDEDAPHPRKGKKGLVTPAKRSEQQTQATRTRTTSTSNQTAKKNSGRSTIPAKIEPAAAPKVEASRAEEPIPPPLLAASDRIEVVEWGTKSPSGTPLLPAPAPLKTVVSTRRYEVDIDPGRVQQIQQALITRGFLSGEATSIYDEATIEAMRQFQLSQKIDATGYPTAIALKRLGL